MKKLFFINTFYSFSFFAKRIVVIFLFFNSCTTNHNKENKIKADKLYKENMSLYKSYFSLQMRDADSAKIVCKILINKFEEIYKIDTVNIEIGDCLVECYFDDRNYRKTIFWCNHQISKRSKESDNTFSFEKLAEAYLNLGEIDSCKKYIIRAIASNKTSNELNNLTPVFLLNLKSYVVRVVYGNDKEAVTLLNLNKISPCQYAMSIFNFILPYSQISTENVKIQFEKDSSLLRKKDCYN